MFPYDIGFLGGGQLARMSIQAAQRLGLRCLSLDLDPDSPAAQVADNLVGSINDVDLLTEVFKKCGRVTLENEFVSPDALEAAILAAGRELSDLTPSVQTLRLIGDKLEQRTNYQSQGVPSPIAFPLPSEPELLDPVTQALGFPMVIKSRYGGYDGKGVVMIQSREDLEANRSVWGNGDWMAEQCVPFTRELSVMVYRSAAQTGAFPTMETVQTDHVCDLVFPAQVDATSVAIQAVNAVEGFGLFGVELFELPDGSVQVNEIAPRPHNSGHFSMDWGSVSQFEQHVRLVMGWPCASPDGQPTCMANLLGQPGASDYRNGVMGALTVDAGAHVHWYGKAQSRPGRKMGHLNVVGDNCVQRAIQARESFYRAWTS